MKSLHSWGSPSRGGIVREQIYLCRYYSVLLMELNVKKNIEMGQKEKGIWGGKVLLFMLGGWGRWHLS